MFSQRPNLIGTMRIARLLWAVLLIGCLGLSGCASMDDFRGKPFVEDDLSVMGRQIRGADSSRPSAAFSNKARQIESSLGGP